MTTKNNVVAVFVRNPEQGKVKTRIAASVGDERALEVYLELLDITFDTLQQVHADIVIYATEPLSNLTSVPFPQKLQAEGDLGKKMNNTFVELSASFHQMILIGSDCPDLSPHHIHTAFDALNDHDVVLGPSADGGYYLIGLNNPQPVLFTDVSWSTENVLKQTIEKASSENLKVHLLPTLNDVDYYEDWVRFKKR